MSLIAPKELLQHYNRITYKPSDLLAEQTDEKQLWDSTLLGNLALGQTAKGGEVEQSLI